MIANVVAMGAAVGGSQQWGAVKMADTDFREVRGNAGGLIEAEARM
jgi:hypothetical protein